MATRLSNLVKKIVSYQVTILNLWNNNPQETVVFLLLNGNLGIFFEAQPPNMKKRRIEPLHYDVTHLYGNCSSMKPLYKRALNFWFMLIFVCGLQAQEQSKTSDYVLGNEEQLEMVVAIWGQVRQPGEYRVPYNTNLVELISISGGPTNDAKLGKVILTRLSAEFSLSEEALESIAQQSQDESINEQELKRRLTTASRKIIHYNVSKYLGDQDMLEPPPLLKPGDVVHVRTSAWTRWREAIRVIHEVALIASIYAWYLRAR